MKKRLKDLFLVTLGALISAIGFNTMFLENNIASGGVGGLAISMNALFGWEPSTFVLLANIPLMALCFFPLREGNFFKNNLWGLDFSYFYQPNCTPANLDNQSTLGSSFWRNHSWFWDWSRFSGKFFHRRNWDSDSNPQQIHSPSIGPLNGLGGWRYCGDWLYCL